MGKLDNRVTKLENNSPESMKVLMASYPEETREQAIEKAGLTDTKAVVVFINWQDAGNL